MNEFLILYPAIAMVVLTACVWVLMYIRRLAEMRKYKIKPKQLATRKMGAAKLKNVTAADNFSNLLEVPVLHYIICLILYVTTEVTLVQHILAWSFVGIRVLHSVVHVSYNNVVHRWVLYMVSTLVVFVMWAVFAVTALTADLV